MSKSAFIFRLGRFVETPVAGEIVRAFVPPSLPPKPPIDVLAPLERLAPDAHDHW
ncbi:hypothetical protein [Brucella pituitosa]|uniref:hypothetical protein n=1 Tax=Brucella pituitosa TaxID=571256 RepID=UPI003F4AEEFA